MLTSLSRGCPCALKGLGIQTQSLGRHFGSPSLPQASNGPWVSIPGQQRPQGPERERIVVLGTSLCSLQRFALQGCDLVV